MKYLILNGPNMNMLGVRKPELYGSLTLAEVEHVIAAYVSELEFAVDEPIELAFFQSNHEGDLIDALNDACGVYDGIVYNPAAHSHYSIALRDAVEAIPVPVVEVHLTDIQEREDFRKEDVIAPVCCAQFCGLGVEGYLRAIDKLVELRQ